METVIAKCHQGDVTSVVFKGNKIQCGSSSVKLPSYEYVHNLVRDNEKKRQSLILKYLDKVDAFVRGGKKDVLADLDPLVKEIQGYDSKITDYKQQYIEASSTNENELYQAIMESLQASKEEGNKVSTYDAMAAKKMLDAHRHRRELFSNWKQVRASWNDKVMVAADKVVVPVPKPVSPKVKGKLTQEDKIELKEKIKHKMLAVFKFKNLEECQSKARSKPFYQSKEEILKLIQENENLKKLMPANFKSLTKEELCKYLI